MFYKICILIIHLLIILYRSIANNYCLALNISSCVIHNCHNTYKVSLKTQICFSFIESCEQVAQSCNQLMQDAHSLGHRNHFNARNFIL